MTKYSTMFLFVSTLLLLLLSRAAEAQQAGTADSPPGYPYANFSPTMVIIVVVLIVALFFMGFFSIYIRHCAADTSLPGVRQLGASLRRRTAAAQGLDRAVLDTFPTFAYSEVKDTKIGKGALECAVCLNEFEEEDTLRLIPKCDHVFHPECIDAWLESHVTCPVCRANLTEPVQTVEPNTEPDQNEQTGEVSIRISDEPVSAETTVPVVDRVQSVKNPSRPPRARSVRAKIWPKFPRSHSTGHSLVQPGANVDRFTLRLPEELRKQVMNRALNQTSSCVVALPRAASSRRGYRTGFGEGTSRWGMGGISFKRTDTKSKSDRWMFSMAPPFFSRNPSVQITDGEGSTSAKTPRGKTAMKLPSFKCLEPKGDEAGLISGGSSRPPV